MKKYDLIIIGGGVLGTFSAYHALKLNKRVLLLEKDSRPFEASFRNFGQGVPSGQKLNKWFDFGRESLAIYKELQSIVDITVKNNGSLYIASDDYELSLIEELNEIFEDLDYESKVLNYKSSSKIQSNLIKSYFKGGLFIPGEISLNPGLMVHKFRDYLIKFLRLDYFFLKTIVKVEKNRGILKVSASDGSHYWGDKVLLTTGKDSQILFPHVFENNNLKVSKLQMLKLKKQNIQIKTNLLTGLTIRRYNSFKSCKSYSKFNYSENLKLLQENGIHILFKQESQGQIILGDSHEYEPVNKLANFGFENSQLINDLILNEAQKIIKLENWEVESVWNGFYLQTEDDEIFVKEIEPNIHAVSGIGGKGMSTGPGFTKQFISDIYN